MISIIIYSRFISSHDLHSLYFLPFVSLLSPPFISFASTSVRHSHFLSSMIYPTLAIHLLPFFIYPPHPLIYIVTLSHIYLSLSFDTSTPSSKILLDPSLQTFSLRLLILSIQFDTLLIFPHGLITPSHTLHLFLQASPCASSFTFIRQSNPYHNSHPSPGTHPNPHCHIPPNPPFPLSHHHPNS